MNYMFALHLSNDKRAETIERFLLIDIIKIAQFIQQQFSLENEKSILHKHRKNDLYLSRT